MKLWSKYEHERPDYSIYVKRMTARENKEKKLEKKRIKDEAKMTKELEKMDKDTIKIEKINAR
jgi:hypothetical protein